MLALLIPVKRLTLMDLGDAVVVIGGGPVGLATALALADQGLQVHLFEGRDDLRRVSFSRGRSINLTLTRRGWTALRRIHLEDRVRNLSMPLRGRTIHLDDGETRHQPYGANGEALDCVSRPELTVALLEHAEARKDITVRFGWKCLGTAPEDGVVTFNRPDGSLERVHCKRILAIDGAMSTVRRGLLSRSEFELSQTYCKHFYKELNVPLGDDGSWPFDPQALHIWPRGDCLLTAFANRGQGFTCALFLPMHGERSFDALGQPRDLQQFFSTNFADLAGHLPQLQRDFYAGAPSHLVSVRCYPWVFGGLALMGDAAHAMFPFLGQGLNAGLEDVSVLMDCLADGRDWEHALAEYQLLRKPNCDAVTEIAAQHYEELAWSARDPDFVLRKRLETRLGELFPQDLASPYHVVSFSDRPYVDARRAAALQRRIIDRLLSRSRLGQARESKVLDHEIISVARSVLEPKTEGA
jgi:kynurenine 3-monooxygenase